MLPQQIILSLHQLSIIDLAGAGRKVAVPKQRHLFQQRRRCGQHPIDPLCGQTFDVASRQRSLDQTLYLSTECIGLGRRDQISDHIRRASADGNVEFFPSCAEASTSEQVRGTRHVPRLFVRRLVG